MADEPKAAEDVGLANLWRFMGYSRPYWPWLATGLAAGLARMLLPLYMPIFLKNVIDGALTPLLQDKTSVGQAWDAVLAMMPLLLALMGVHALSSVGRFYLPNVAGTNAVRDIRYYLFRHLQRLSLSFHTKRPSGTIVARVVSDVTAAQYVFDLVLIQTSQMALQMVAIGGYLLTQDWLWALVCFATTPVFVFATRVVRGPMRQASRETRESVERMSGHVQERMAMIREVQSFTAESHEQRHIRGEVETLKKSTLRQYMLQALLVATAEVTRYAGLVVVVLFGVYRIVAGHAKIGDVTAFYIYAGMLLNPVQFLSSVYTQLHQAAAAADRVFEFFDSTPDIQDAADARPFKVRCPEVRYDEVSFSYPTDSPMVVLRDISFTAAPGSRVALVGESGSGKTTLLGLLPRFYDVQQGRILIDGRDVREVTVRSLRQAIGIVPQEPVLFTGTIRDNIRYGRRDADDADIAAAARLANAEHFIREQPDGYDTLVGERGVGLSGGQVQRIAIARAFLKDPAILILDEATSNLDATSEALVLEAISRLARGRTTFIIAHRLSTARDADLILVLDAGRIIESGPHDQLLAAGGAYAALWERQMGTVG